METLSTLLVLGKGPVIQSLTCFSSLTWINCWIIIKLPVIWDGMIIMDTTWHVESQDVEFKHTLQPPRYHIIIVNRFNCTNKSVTKSRSPKHPELNIMLRPDKFKSAGYSRPLWIFYALLSQYCYRQLLWETFYYDNERIAECDVSDCSTAYIYIYTIVQIDHGVSLKWEVLLYTYTAKNYENDLQVRRTSYFCALWLFQMFLAFYPK